MEQPILLALRALKIGDVLVAVPALRGLRRSFPDHKIVLGCADYLRPLAQLSGAVDDVLATPRGLDEPLAIPAGVVDVAVNLHGNGPESRGRLEALAATRNIGHAAPGWTGPEWLDEIHERQRWTRLLNWHGIDADPLDYRLDGSGLALPTIQTAEGTVPLRQPYSVVHVGAAHASRHWPVGRFAEVITALVEQGHRVLLTGSEGERGRAEDVAEQAAAQIGANVARRRVHMVAGQLSLQQFIAVIAHTELLLSADTGAAHLATAFGRTSVILFGPAAPEIWGPPPGPHRVLTDAAQRRGDAFADTPDPALLAVGTEDVLAAIDSLADV